MPKKITTAKKPIRPSVKTSGRRIKKSAPATFTKSDKTYTPDTVTTASADIASAGVRPLKVHKLTLIIAAAIILLGLLLYFGRSLVVAAVVNGQPITRLELVQETERQSGKQALTTLIRNILINQEAKKNNITASDKEVNDQIKTIESNLTKQGQKLDQMLALEGMTRADLNKIIYQDLLVTKLVGKDIKISDKEINDYLANNKDSLPKGKNEKELKQYAADQLKKAQLPQKAQAWLAEVEKKASVVKFVNY